MTRLTAMVMIILLVICVCVISLSLSLSLFLYLSIHIYIYICIYIYIYIYIYQPELGGVPAFFREFRRGLGGTAIESTQQIQHKCISTVKTSEVQLSEIHRNAKLGVPLGSFFLSAAFGTKNCSNCPVVWADLHSKSCKSFSQGTCGPRRFEERVR